MSFAIDVTRLIGGLEMIYTLEQETSIIMNTDIELITVSATANLLSVHRTTVYRLIQLDPDFPEIYEFKFGKRFNKDDVLEYINSRKSA
ncbi:helix-turn-helix transcriptional regulator [Vreelandella andesensis]|uniref:helix-turn-helix transcriptional regulator n=1 Tax=Vreelandella andesensis TaxID=447567 RepID=UPI00142D7D78|nr:helix-turn-helix domain-containing protein [Halomonas andesensis]